MIGDGDGNGILCKHGYVCLCLCVCARRLSRPGSGGVFLIEFLSWYVRKIVRQYSFLFSGNTRILFKTTAMERFFYSIIEFLVSRSLTLSISKQDDSVHSISLLTGGHRSGRIPSAAGGEEVQR